MLKDLTADERQCLRPFIVKGENTVIRSMRDGVVGGLVAKGILYQASRVGYAGYDYNFSYNLHPWARKYLTKNKRLVEE